MTVIPAFAARHVYILTVTIATVLLSDQPLTSSYLFTMVPMAGVMMWSMTGFFPMAVMFGSQGYTSARRLQVNIHMQTHSK